MTCYQNQGYSTDLSEEQWAILQPVLPPSGGRGRPRKLPLLMQMPKQTNNRVGRFLISVDLQQRTLWIGVAEIPIAGVADRADVEHRFVAPVATGKQHLSRRVGRFAK